MLPVCFMWFLDPFQFLLKCVIGVPKTILKMCHRLIKVEVMTSPFHQRSHSSPISESSSATHLVARSKFCLIPLSPLRQQSISRLCPHNMSWTCSTISTLPAAKLPSPLSYSIAQTGLSTSILSPFRTHRTIQKNISLVQSKIDHHSVLLPNYSSLIIE